MDAQSLMQMFMAAQSSGGGLDSGAMLSQIASASDDPTTRMMGTMMASQQAANAAREDDDDDDEDDERDEKLKSALERLDGAQATLARVYDELELMRGRNQLLAEALGACFSCWGSKPTCPVCSGAGRSGSIDPNPALFARFVVPALRRMSQVQRRQGGGNPARTVQPTPRFDEKEI